MPNFLNPPGGNATDVALTDRVLVSQGSSDRSATVTQLQTAVLSQSFKFRTPENSGLSVDRTNTTDTTAALNSFLSLLASSGDEGRLAPGLYKTTASLVAPTGSLNLRGTFGKTIIMPTAATYHGLRIASGGGSGLGGSIIPRVVVEGLMIRGPNTSPTKNGFAGIVFDATTQFLGENLLVEGFDIGFDQINNCYNGTWRNIFTSRNVGTVNVGYNARTDSQNGCDINVYNAQLTGIQTAICISGTGGGYRFYGASLGTTNTATLDKYGIVTLGWNYIDDAEAGGLGSIIFSGLHMEGWRGQHAFRAYGSVNFGVEATGFVPSASTGTLAAGIYKHTNAQGSLTTWLQNDIGGGSFATNDICTISGDNDDFQMLELGWSSSAMTSVGGSSRSRSWMRTLGTNSTTYFGDPKYVRSFGYYQDNYPVLVLGRTRLRVNTADGTWQQSNDGSIWEAFGRPFTISQGGSNQNTETSHCPARITMTSGSANTVTVRADADASLPIGSRIQVVQQGAGQTTITPAAGVTVRGTPGLKLRAQNSVGWIEKISANTWIAWGDLSA